VIGDDQIIADIKEMIDPEDKTRQYIFNNPYRVILQPTMTLMEDASGEPPNTSQVSLATWQPLTSDTMFIVNPSTVQTVFEPVVDLKNMYKELIDALN